ncbi:MAG: class I SAM-dependent methyltransferase [Chloroflexi bacterium]|nr:class I SAM-dependent methyltransferase [Chloroflexota bacterium]
MRRLVFAFLYAFTRPRWDTNITPPELVDLIEAQKLPPGRALDLGCGTGTNVIYLARHGWQAVGIDFVGRAVAEAKRKARANGVRAEFFQADATRLEFLQPPFDLAFDIGCFHSIPADRRAHYLSGLARLLRPGGLFLCYAFKPSAPMGGLEPDEGHLIQFHVCRNRALALAGRSGRAAQRAHVGQPHAHHVICAVNCWTESPSH